MTYIPVRYERICAYCGKEFVAHDNRKIFCSKKCKDIALRLKKGIQCNPNPEPYHKICKVCGKPFDSFRKASVTCSHECAVKYKSPKKRGTPITTTTTEMWVNKRHGDSFEYVKHTRGRIWLRCKSCGQTIERATSTVRQKNINCEYCKEDENLKEARQKMMCFFIALKESKTPKRCVVCGKEFYSQYPTQLYCSNRCRCKKKRSNNGFRSRCRHYGVFYDSSVTRKKVIKRDNGICQICGKKCNPLDLRWGTIGPDFPTVDHIIPLAKGGTHTWDNVQCACAICNSNKRDLLDYEDSDMAKVDFKLNLPGLNQLMKSKEMQAHLQAAGDAVVSASNGNYGADVHVADFVAIANVYPEDLESYRKNMENNELLKAVGAAGLPMG